MEYRFVDPDATGTGTGIGVDSDPTNPLNYTNAYTSVSAWNTAEATNLVTATEAHTMYYRNSGGSAETISGVNLSGWGTSATYPLVIEVAEGSDATKEGYDATKARWVSTSSAMTLQSYTTIKGFQFVLDTLAGSYASILGVNDELGVVLDSCYFYGQDVEKCWGFQVSGTTEVYIKNSIFVGFERYAIYQSDESAVALYNSIIKDSGTAGIYSTSATSTCIAKNTAFIGNTVNFSFLGTVTQDYCATLLGEGTNPIIPLNSDWVYEMPDYATNNFTLTSTGNLYESGIGPNLDSLCPVVDMEGDVISGDTCSIGVDSVSTAILTYTLTYDGNGNDSGTVLTDSSSPYDDGSTVTVLGESDLGLTGYTFGGWNTASDGSGTSYAETDTFTISANTTLYAQWDLVIVTYTVTYDGNSNDGGTVPVDGSSPYDSGSSVTILGNTGSLTLTGYIFVAWNTASDGTGTNRESTDTFTISADTTLYALWKTEAELIEAYLTPATVGGRRPRARYLGV